MLITIHLKLVGSRLTMMLIDNSCVLPGDAQLFIIIHVCLVVVQLNHNYKS